MDHTVPPISFSNPPPPIPNEIDKSLQNCLPMGFFEGRNFSDLLSPRRSTSLKRQWKAIEDLGSRGIYSNQNEAKKCKRCDVMEFRLQYNKDKMEKMLQSKQELEKKSAVLDKKSDKLYSIIMALLKHSFSPKPPTHTNGLSSMNGDKDKTLLDQLNAILSVNNRLSALGEDK